jgi:hypothetical protein
VIWQFSTEPYFQQPLHRKSSAPWRVGRWAAVSSSHLAGHPIHPAALGPAHPTTSVRTHERWGLVPLPSLTSCGWVDRQCVDSWFMGLCSLRACTPPFHNWWDTVTIHLSILLGTRLADYQNTFVAVVFATVHVTRTTSNELSNCKEVEYMWSPPDIALRGHSICDLITI